MLVCPCRFKPGGRRLGQHNSTDASPARDGDCEEWPRRHQESSAQQAHPKGSEQKNSELQGGVSLRRGQYRHTQLLPGEQERHRVCKSHPNTHKPRARNPGLVRLLKDQFVSDG